MHDDDLVFVEENPAEIEQKKEHWKVMIVDDDEDIHDVTKFVLKNFEFEKKTLEFISAYTGEEAKKLIKQNPDTALILLDVVMEEEDSGLKFIKYLREELGNDIVRIILRTGQPGVAPQTKVVIDYDINDYKEKTELTREKFCSSVVMALRSYKTLRSLQISLKELETSAKAAERFIPHNLLKLINKKNISEVKLGDYALQEMTVLFMDIRMLTEFVEHLPPEESLNIINSCMQHLEPVIKEENGFIDIFINDAIMALFYGPPDNAILASIEMAKSLERYNNDVIKNKGIKVGIGIYSGQLMLGTIGSEERMNVTALGSVVHLAAMIEKLNRHYNTNILVGDETIKRLVHPDNFHYRRIAHIVASENIKSFSVYEIMDGDDAVNMELKLVTKSIFESALQDYIDNRFDDAELKFKDVIAKNPQDDIAKLYLQIIQDQL